MAKAPYYKHTADGSGDYLVYSSDEQLVARVGRERIFAEMEHMKDADRDYVDHHARYAGF